MDKLSQIYCKNCYATRNLSLPGPEEGSHWKRSLSCFTRTCAQPRFRVFHRGCAQDLKTLWWLIWNHWECYAPQGRKNSAQVQFIHSKWPFRRTKMIHVWSILKSPKAQQTKNKSWAFLELGFLRPTHFQIQKAQQLGAKSPMENLCLQPIWV